MARIRCWWHIIIGIGLAWLPLGAMLTGAILFCFYELLQFCYATRIPWKWDDSFLDVKETGIAFGISIAVKMIVGV